MGKDTIGLITQMNPNQISRRLPEMEKMGLVELTGNTVTSLSGRQEREWRAL
jgi:DNA-binding transcriptional regulator YhcF (GntR family)